MTILEEHEIYHMDELLHAASHNHPADPKTIEWAKNFIKNQPITLLKAQLAQAQADVEVFTAKWVESNTQLALARAGVESLKHLQKYEGMQKIESDEIGHKAAVALLKDEIVRLRRELEEARR
jgi:hypothetical protein